LAHAGRVAGHGRWTFKSAAGLLFSKMSGSELDVIQDTKILRGQFD
jgi:hypothetical protein